MRREGWDKIYILRLTDYIIQAHFLLRFLVFLQLCYIFRIGLLFFFFSKTWEGVSAGWRNLLPTALTVSTSFHLYRYYSMFIALLLRVILYYSLPWPPRLEPTIRSRMTEFPKWSPIIQTPHRILLQTKEIIPRYSSFPAPSQDKRWVGTAIPGRLACNHQTVASSRLRRGMDSWGISPFAWNSCASRALKVSSWEGRCHGVVLHVIIVCPIPGLTSSIPRIQRPAWTPQAYGRLGRLSSRSYTTFLIIIYPRIATLQSFRPTQNNGLFIVLIQNLLKILHFLLYLANWVVVFLFLLDIITTTWYTTVSSSDHHLL